MREWEAATPALALEGLDLMELDSLAARIARRVQRLLGHDLVNVTLVDKGELVVRGTVGSRTKAMTGMRFPARTGLGGLAVLERRPVLVADYAAVDWPLPMREVMVEREGIRAAACVPLFVHSEPVGLLFLGRRGREPIPESDVRFAQELSLAAEPLILGAMRLGGAVEAARIEERQRIAHQVHDELIPLLFGIGAATRRTRALLSADAMEALTCLASIEALTASASSVARDALPYVGHVRRDEDLVLRARAAVARFTALAGVEVSVGVVGAPIALDEAATEALAGVVTEALNNVVKHAPSASAAVAVTFGADRATVAVMDDGGLGASRQLCSAGDSMSARSGPRTESGYGLASLKYRMALLGGSLEVGQNEDGGTTVRASISVRIDD